MPSRELDDIKDDVTDLRIAAGRNEEKHTALDHRVRNTQMQMQMLERRINRIEAQLTWILRIVTGGMTSVIGAGYAAMKKLGLV